MKHKRRHHDQPVTRRQMVRAMDRLKQDIIHAIIHSEAHDGAQIWDVTDPQHPFLKEEIRVA